jgi:hypothetical protein
MTHGRHFDNIDEFNMGVKSDMLRYESMNGPFETERKQASSNNSNSYVFNPLVWWGQNTHKFPLLSRIAKQILVIPASSAESERHFSTAGKLTRKDRANLSAETVEASVLLAQALKKTDQFINVKLINSLKLFCYLTNCEFIIGLFITQYGKVIT